ncbi:MAG TPA: hypothetical protein VKX16_12980, partial [Chloroflexota bacterium]|nr:hypothetical protein [Chloroflexota bacterium]
HHNVRLMDGFQNGTRHLLQKGRWIRNRCGLQHCRLYVAGRRPKQQYAGEQGARDEAWALRYSFLEGDSRMGHHLPGSL